MAFKVTLFDVGVAQGFIMGKQVMAGDRRFE
jgi:hypothetical protein